MAATTKTKISDIEKLKASRGWRHLEQIMRDEMLTAARMIATNPNMPEKEVDWRRGTIWAAEQLLDLPDKVIHRLKSELALEDLDRAAPLPKSTKDDT